MSAIIALLVLGLWAIVSFGVARLLVSFIKDNNIKILVNVVLAGFFFILPVADDIAGGFQFRALCNTGAVIAVDEGKARDKSVIYVGGNSQLNNYILPIRKHYLGFNDVNTGELLISWNEYHAEGGWLSHVIGFPEGNPPYTFDGFCSPKNAGSKLFKRLNVMVNYN